MRIRKQCFLVLAGICLIAHISVAAEGWVAQPGKALEAEWPVSKFAGRDCWLMFFEGLLEMEGVKDEPFIRNGGTHLIRFERVGGLEKLNVAERATLAIKELELYDADDKLLSADAWRVDVSSENPDVKFYYLESLRDGNTQKAFVAVGDERKIASDKTMQVVFTIRPQLGCAIKRIVFAHGLQGNGRIGETAIEAAGDAGRWDAVEFSAQTSKDKDRLELIPVRLLQVPAFRITCDTQPMILALHPAKFPHQDCLKERPFRFTPFYKRYLPGLRPSQMDKAGIDEICKTYPDTFQGFMIAEWDSTLWSLVQTIRNNPQSAEAKKILKVFPCYTNRVEAYASVQHYFNYQKSLFHGARVLGHSGGITWPQYAAEWGAHALEMQLSGSKRNSNDRMLFTFIRSAARQYDLPWSAYVAVPGDFMAAPTFYKPGHGKAPSLFFREWMMGYYFGATFFEVESQHIGSLTLHDKATGLYRLSPHGEVAKKFYDWTRNIAGARGTCYAPILFLADIRHGRTGRRARSPEMDWKVWQDLEMDDGDYMFEHFAFTVEQFVDSRTLVDRSKYGDTSAVSESSEQKKCVEAFFAKLDPMRYKLEDYPAPYSPNQRNSRIADGVDVFFANPPSQGGVIKKEHLDKYAVALLMGDIEMTDALAERLKTYVKEGGTLVINSAQCKGQMADENLLGLTVGTELKEENGMEILPVNLKTAEVVRKSEQGTPLVTRSKYGKGHVLVTTPRYMVMKERKESNPLIEKLLTQLQDETLPIKFKGNCQFMLNKVAPENWHAVVINNQGVIKNSEVDETIFLQCYDSAVTLDAPAGVKVREVFADAALDIKEDGGRTKVKVLVPAGQVRVVEFIGNIMGN